MHGASTQGVEAAPATGGAPSRRRCGWLGTEHGFTNFDSLLDDELTHYFHHTVFPDVTITDTPDGVHFFRTKPDRRTWNGAPSAIDISPPRSRSWTGRDRLRDAPVRRSRARISRPRRQQRGHHLGDFIDQDLSMTLAQSDGYHSLGYANPYLRGRQTDSGFPKCSTVTLRDVAVAFTGPADDGLRSTRLRRTLVTPSPSAMLARGSAACRWTGCDSCARSPVWSGWRVA